jgi:hypothetical protein
MNTNDRRSIPARRIALAAAKRRGARREQQAGAALFVVSMTIAVLASVGIYALAAAANEVKTSGYERQSVQTHYLSTYGVLGAAHEIVSTRAQFYMGLMLSTPDVCPGSLPGVPATASIITRACRRMGSQELAIAWASGPPALDAYSGVVPYQAGATPGSFGPTTTQGDFFVELTEPTQANPPARYGLNLNFCFIELTATSTGFTQPVFATPNYTATYGAEGLEMQRARLLAGPVQCPR